MPELPEVETVKRELSKRIIGKTFLSPTIYFEGMIKTNLEEYKKGVCGKTIVDLQRRGKFLIVNLNDDHRLIFHLRMEGKIYVENKERHSMAHLSMFIPFQDCDEGFAFYDTRKFGVSYYVRKDDDTPLEHLGPEPFDLDSPDYLYRKYTRSSKPIKELLMDQTIMSGLGNIYTDEVLHACHLSPFMCSKKLTKENCAAILDESKQILSKSIDFQGSTIRTYQATESVHGNFQTFLKVYSKAGQTCPTCGKAKIEKRRLGGRGTSLCPVCQKAGINIAVTGKIASGKSLATSYFEKHGFKRFSFDEQVHLLYSDESFLKELKKKFPRVFTPTLDKKVITQLLQEDKTFKRKYLNYVYATLKERMNQFIVENDGKDKVFEVPVLFDAHMQKEFTILVGTETTKQLAHLKERGEGKERKNFNALNSYDKHRKELNYILHTDGTKKQLEKQVLDVIRDLQNKGMLLR